MKKLALFYVVIAVLFFNKTLYAQVLISKPSFKAITVQACGSTSFNNFNVTFTFSPESALESSNQFIAELSDGQGSFSNPTVIYSSEPGAIVTSPVDFSFSLPTTTSGEAYRMRVRSTAPAFTSQSSTSFPAYYKIHDTDFSINNLISTAMYCSGGSYLLSIDNDNKFSGDSPLIFPSLTFNWYKETGPTTSMFIVQAETLEVSEPGTYFVETNYGSCSSDSFSNRVTVSEVSSGATSSINSSLGNPYCSGDGPTVLSTISGDGYQWFKNGEVIVDATNQTYETNESGRYSVNVDLGTCTTSATIDLESTGFESSIDVENVNEIDDGETLTATVTATANDPEYKWYLDDVLINGAVNSSYDITQEGTYRVTVTQTTGCNSSAEFNFLVEIRVASLDVEKIPNLISPNGDGINDNWIIPRIYGSGTNTEVLIINTQGKVELKTDAYQNNWPENQSGLGTITSVFYYIITTASGNTERGTITVIK